MSGIFVTIGVTAAAIVLAIATVVGLVSTQSNPSSVNKPLVSYGTR
jgi:hypothetical protein